ncbi:VCBS domain-containing protein [Endozoicomonas ascidiicola]|nr:VCBS domain-containing protein [Endozoicomonas ascidiicola]
MLQWSCQDNTKFSLSFDGGWSTSDAPTIEAATDVTGGITEMDDNAAGELTTTLSDNGSFTIADVDLTNTQSINFTSASADYLGDFSIDLADDTTSDGSGRVNWNFDIADSVIDDLTEGQTLTQTYTVTVTDDDGASVDQDVVITITGTNDAPTIETATDVTASITEIEDGTAGAGTVSHSESGNFTIADVELAETQSVAYSAADSNYVGTLNVSVGDDTLGDGTGRIDWDFSVDDSALELLAEGETVNQTYTVTVTDSASGTVDQDIVITLTGSNNEAPTIEATTKVTGGITELDENAAGESTTELNDNGSFTIADTDLSNTQSVSYAAAGSSYLGNFSATVGDDTVNDGSGRIDWDFAVADSALDYLAAGETLIQTYTVTVSDGDGGTVDQDIVITLTGTNDDPEITSSTTSGSITELADGAAGERTATLSDNGSLAFDYVDLSNSHTASYASAASGYLGNFSINTNNPSGNNSGSVDWSFEVSDGDIDYLADGETLNQT